MKSVLKYPGAKNRLAPWICEYIPKHDVYLEPFAAIIAVGVARTNEHGQNTTKIVTALIISPLTIQVIAAALSAIITIQVAHLSASPTIFALPASADSTNRIIR